jgi:hypothetical protein
MIAVARFCRRFDRSEREDRKMRDGGRRGGISQDEERATRGKRPTITSPLSIIFSEFGATIGTYPKAAVGLSAVVS